MSESFIASIDERLIALAMRRTGGAKEIFRRIKDEHLIDGIANRELYLACRDVFEAMKRKAMILPADLIVSKLDERGSLGKVGQQTIERLLTAEIASNELEATIIAVLERQQTKELSSKMLELREKMQSDDVSVVDAAAIARELSDLSRARADLSAGKIIGLTDILDELEHIEDLPDCIATGFPLLDEMLGGGLAKGGYHIIASPTGSGKTILMLSMWKNMLDNGIRPIYLNYEISRPVFLKFLFAQITGCNVWKRNLDPDYVEHKKQEFTTTIERMFEQNLMLLSDPMQGSPKTWHDIDGMARDLVDTYGADCIFLDTVNSISAATGKRGQEQRWNEYETIAIELERFNQELNVATVISAQMDRKIDREDKTPVLGDVAGSKTLSEKATSVIHLHRTDLLDKTKQIRYSELHITKNRVIGQELGMAPVRVKYDVDYKRLYELPRNMQSTNIVDLSEKTYEGPFLDGSSVPGMVPPIPELAEIQ